VEAGPLVTLLHACATNLPLQTPSYAALTLGVDAMAPSTHAGFASRCVTLAMQCLGRDLDGMLDCCTTTTTNSMAMQNDGHEETMKEERERCHAELWGGHGNGMQVDAYYRAKLTLRFLAHLANIGIISMRKEQQQTHDQDGNNLSFLGVLQLLVQCACQAASSNDRALRRASVILASLVLSTLPYLNLEEVYTAVADLLEELETHVLGSSYSSDYEPGAGWEAILLKGELDDGEDMEDGEEDDDDDDDSPAPSCADTLQDLLRTVRKLINSSQNEGIATRFALLTDAPWKCLKSATASEEMQVEEGGFSEAPVAYSGKPLLLDLVGSEEEKRCKCVPYILSSDTGDNARVELNCRMLDGIIFGRLAIFDAPPDPDDEEDDEEDGDVEKDPNLESYIKSFSLMDRFFLADTIRDVLMCHRPMVSDAGADRSNAKEVAEQIWMVSHLLYPEASPSANKDAMTPSDEGDVSKGIEYGIVETLLSLIVQSTPRECDVPATSALNQHLYLARVLLELTKLKPALVPRAIVRAISGMYEDFIPSLTPVARDNLATWLALHLFNTDYQWPKSFWEHWASHVTGTKRSSRGDFVTMVLHTMAGLSSEGAVTIVKDCLPPNSPLVQSVFLTDGKNCVPSATELDLIDRFWNANHDPDSIRQFVISDELTHSFDAIEDENEDHSMFHRSVWWRTRLVTRALLHPSIRDQKRDKRLVIAAFKKGGGDLADETTMNDDHIDDVDPTEDLLTDLSDAISRYKPVVLAALAKDADAYDSISSGRVDDDQLLLAGEVSILKEFENALPLWDTVAFNTLIQCLMKTKIVSNLSVASWAIGDSSNGSPRSISPQWWKYVSIAVNETILSIEGSTTDLGGGIGMIIDDAGNDEDASEAAAKRLDEALKAVVPVLKCAIEQGSQLLTMTDDDTKIPPVGADAVEGIKRLFNATLFFFFHHFSSDPPAGMCKLAFASVLKGFSDMELGGDKLSSMFQESMPNCRSKQGTKLIQSLSTAFEKMV
jgi:hypothetical protein